MDLTRLVAKEVHKPAAIPAATPHLTYAVQWQASDRAINDGDTADRPVGRRPVEWLVTSGKQQCALMT